MSYLWLPHLTYCLQGQHPGRSTFSRLLRHGHAASAGMLLRFIHLSPAKYTVANVLGALERGVLRLFHEMFK